MQYLFATLLIPSSKQKFPLKVWGNPPLAAEHFQNFYRALTNDSVRADLIYLNNSYILNSIL